MHPQYRSQLRVGRRIAWPTAPRHSHGEIASTNSGVTRIKSSISFTLFCVLRNGTPNRQVRDIRQTASSALAIPFLDQTGQGKRLPGFHFHGRVHFANCEPNHDDHVGVGSISLIRTFQADVGPSTMSQFACILFELDRRCAQTCGTMIGNSPPTLNCAGRPLTATMFGSARILAMLFCCST